MHIKTGKQNASNDETIAVQGGPSCSLESQALYLSFQNCQCQDVQKWNQGCEVGEKVKGFESAPKGNCCPGHVEDTGLQGLFPRSCLILSDHAEE